MSVLQCYRWEISNNSLTTCCFSATMVAIKQQKDKALAPDLQHYYDESFSMMATKGWKMLMEDLQQIKNTVNELSTVLDSQSLFNRQGQLDILNLLLTRKEACEAAYDSLQEASE
jgi:hypothetical protein